MINGDQKIDFENSIGPWLGKTIKLVDFYIQEMLNDKGLDLTKEQMIVLKRLHDEDGLNQNELAFLTLRNKSSLTRLLHKMEKKGYILRMQSQEDKRINNIYLTQDGRDLFNKTKPIILKIISTMEKGISKKEKFQMIELLKKIQLNFSNSVESI